MWCENLKVLVFDSSYQCNMSAFPLDSARKLWLVSLHQPWTSQDNMWVRHMSTVQYATSCGQRVGVNTCG